MHAGLARDDLFTVVLEQRLTDTARFADIVLPATMQPEHLDLHDSYGHHYVTLNLPAVEPPGECLPNSEIFRRLARALGLDHPRLRESDEADGARRARLRRGARGRHHVRAAARRGRAARDDPRGSRASPRAASRRPAAACGCSRPSSPSTGADPLVGYVPPHELEDAELAERYPLALLSPASRLVLNSTFASLPWHRGRLGPPRVHLHPDDAGERGIESGARVRVHNDRGVVPRRGRRRRRRAARRRVHLQAAVAAAARARASTSTSTIPERDADLGGSPTFHDNRVQIELDLT